jgi:hypothetical protein
MFQGSFIAACKKNQLNMTVVHNDFSLKILRVHVQLRILNLLIFGATTEKFQDGNIMVSSLQISRWWRSENDRFCCQRRIMLWLGFVYHICLDVHVALLRIQIQFPLQI